MAKAIAAGDLFQGGRINAYDPSTGLSFLRYSEILDPADNGLEFNFPNAQATGNVFGSVRSMFVDNSNNDYEVRVTVAGTRQTFPISANSTGIYPIDSQLGSTILVETAGVSTDFVEFIFYNYPQAPFVWFKTGNTVTANVTIANGDDVALGSTTDPAITNPVTDGTLIAFTRGILTGINSIVTALGSLVVSGSVTIADGADVAQGATTDVAITNPATNGTLIGFTRGILTGVNSTVTALGTVIGHLVTLLTDTAFIVTNTSDTVTNTADIVVNTGAFSYNNISTNTTTAVKGSPGVLGSVVINTGGSVVGSVVVYDNTAGSGSIIATIDAQIAGTYEYNATATTGITVVTTGSPNVTILYR